jgi:hypothetical protein
MNIAEPIADAMTGSVIANAAEPQTGIDASGHTTEQSCLNCQTSLVGTYCHACGQHSHVHRSLGAFGHDLLHGVFHFEGKIWRTIPMLLFRPGQLTRRYIEGERAQFVSPVALFLFSVFLMFAMVSAVGGPVSFMNSADAAQERAKLDGEYKTNRQKMLKDLQQLQTERGQLAGGSSVAPTLDKRIKEKQAELRVQQELYSAATAVVSGEQVPDVDVPEGLDTGAGERNIVVVGGADNLNGWFNTAYKKAKKNPSLLFYKLQTNGYKYSWALIPLSVPFLWLLSAITFIPPIHMYKQLRGAYALSRFSALWRTLALIAFATIAATLFALLLLLLGVLG